MSINFRQLEVFRAVAEINSFTRASRSLFVSQSTVSQHIRKLEDLLGVKLFHRNRRIVSLTSAGENLLEHSKSIFQMIERAEQAAKGGHDSYCGNVSFACASTTLVYQLPPVLIEYANRYPNVKLNITAGTIQHVATQIWSGTVDLALVVLPISGSGLQKVPLFEESFVLAIPADHTLAKNAQLSIGHVAAEHFILYRPGQNTRKLVDHFLFKERIAPRVAIELEDTEAIKEMVARGFGVSVLPQSAFPAERTYAGIRTIPIPSKDLHRSLAVVYPRTKIVRPVVTALIQLLQELFRTSPRVSSAH